MDKLKSVIIKFQKAEITEHHIYKNIAHKTKDPGNKKVLLQISDEEKKHYEYWKTHSQMDVAPDRFKVAYYTWMAKFLGLTFAVKLMESGENSAQNDYAKLIEILPDVKQIIADEQRHEGELLNMIDEERLKYVSSVVLGLNDALVELTGALAGFTLALQKTKLIAVVGLITGIAASMSMAAAEYLSTKQEQTDKSPVKASIYTGIAYVATVLFLITPYLIFSNAIVALLFVMSNAILIVLVFTFYISVAKELSFKHRFAEMAGLSLSIALINFFIGWAIKNIFGVDV